MSGHGFVVTGLVFGWPRLPATKTKVAERSPGAVKQRLIIHGYDSMWLPAALLRNAEHRGQLSDALFEAGRIWPIELHFQKGLAGGSPDVIKAMAQTATNPAMHEAFVLAIMGSEGPPARPGLPGYQPDLVAARSDAAQIGKAMTVLRMLVPDSGSYVAESNFFEPDWQRSY